MSFSILPSKAPKPNGMSHIFFQKFWHFIGKDVVCAIHNFFYSGFLLLKYVNEIIITLISKVEAPCNLSHFKPINLYNDNYKEIAKILVNRMKSMLGFCIS